MGNLLPSSVFSLQTHFQRRFLKSNQGATCGWILWVSTCQKAPRKFPKAWLLPKKMSSNNNNNNNNNNNDSLYTCSIHLKTLFWGSNRQLTGPASSCNADGASTWRCRCRPLPSLKRKINRPGKWMVGVDDPLLLGKKAYFHGRTLSFREGKGTHFSSKPFLSSLKEYFNQIWLWTLYLFCNELSCTTPSLWHPSVTDLPNYHRKTTWHVRRLKSYYTTLIQFVDFYMFHYMI